MKLTRSVSYAVGILLKIQANKTKKPMTAAKIAKGAKFPPRFLYRVLRRLVDAGLLEGVAGPGGGYTLARSPREITLLEIIEAVEGFQSTEKLTPAAPRQSKAIKHINEIVNRNCDRLARDLDRVTLARLSRL